MDVIILPMPISDAHVVNAFQTPILYIKCVSIRTCFPLIRKLAIKPCWWEITFQSKTVGVGTVKMTYVENCHVFGVFLFGSTLFCSYY